MMSFFKQMSNAPLCNLLLYCVLLFFLHIFITWKFHTMHPDPLFPGLSLTFEPALPLKEEEERTEAEKEEQKCGREAEGRGGSEEKEEQEQ